MTLRLGANATELIHTELCRAYPEEGCGVMLGTENGEDREVVRAVPLGNQRADSRGNRYLISPEQFLDAERTARREGLDVLGFFHSHPDHPARPSAFDLEHAWPWYSYLIVSVEHGRVRDVTAWRLNEDRSRFEPEAVETVPAGRPRASGEATT